MRPTVSQLEAFLAVARTLSFRRAAEESFVSQSALSAQVKRLEEQLGTTLFERDRRRTRLTPEGERARALAQGVLQQLDELQAAMRPDGDPLAGTIRLGIIPTIAPFLVPKLSARVAEAHPNTQIRIQEDTTARLVSKVQAGELDAILLDVDVELGSLRHEVLFEEALLLAVGSEHELASHASVTLDEVSDRELLLLEEGHCLSERIRGFCRPARDGDTHDFRATSLVTLVQLVAAGQGATLVPEMAATDLASVPGLVLVPFAPKAPSRRIGLAWRPTDGRERAFRSLGELVEGC